jgi:hypothetical protein
MTALLGFLALAGFVLVVLIAAMVVRESSDWAATRKGAPRPQKRPKAAFTKPSDHDRRYRELVRRWEKNNPEVLAEERRARVDRMLGSKHSS